MTVIADTGVLVALIDPDTQEHDWVCRQIETLPLPFLTSEAVLTEAAFLLSRDGFDADELFALAETGMFTVGLEFNQERQRLRELIRTYRRHGNKVIPVLLPED